MPLSRRKSKISLPLSKIFTSKSTDPQNAYCAEDSVRLVSGVNGVQVNTVSQPLHLQHNLVPLYDNTKLVEVVGVCKILRKKKSSVPNC